MILTLKELPRWISHTKTNVWNGENRKISSLILHLVHYMLYVPRLLVREFLVLELRTHWLRLSSLLRHTLECVIRTGLFAVLNNGIEFISPNGVGLLTLDFVFYCAIVGREITPMRSVQQNEYVCAIIKYYRCQSIKVIKYLQIMYSFSWTANNHFCWSF